MFSFHEAPKVARTTVHMLHHNTRTHLHPAECMMQCLGRVANVLGILGCLGGFASIPWTSKAYHADAGTPIGELLVESGNEVAGLLWTGLRC